jgi:hypothetical protein
MVEIGTIVRNHFTAFAAAHELVALSPQKALPIAVVLWLKRSSDLTCILQDAADFIHCLLDPLLLREERSNAAPQAPEMLSPNNAVKCARGSDAFRTRSIRRSMCCVR